MKTIYFSILFFLAFNASAAPSNEELASELQATSAKLSELRKEFDALKKTLEPVLTELSGAGEESIHPAELLLKKNLENNYSLGKVDAPVVIMEFFDFQCGFCAEFHKHTFPSLKKKYIDTGKLKFIFRDFVLGGHAMGAGAASLASCAGQQDKYLAAQDVLFGNPDRIESGHFKSLYSAIPGINKEKMEKCLKSEPFRTEKKGEELLPSKKTEFDMIDAHEVGVHGTPAFFIYKNAPVNTKVLGTFIAGNEDIQVFEETIEKYLGEGHG